MSVISKFAKSSAGKVAVPIAVVLLLALVVYQVKGFFGKSAAAAAGDSLNFICSETHRGFQVSVNDLIGKDVPILSPYSGKKTGYPAELCYWTKEGTAKSDPTPVLMNSSIGIRGPTFCPDCGRLVVGHNPTPAAGVKAPPTKEEYGSAK